jgi:hypothetical protein
MPPTKQRPRNTDRQRRGFIHAYGLFWDVGEVIWFPSGRGSRGQFRLLGRVGGHRGNLQVCDFRAQRGIYVLYDDYGPYYVGLTRTTPIGNRLRQHMSDRHADKWDRFSWFGFRPVLGGTLADGTRGLGRVPQRLLTDSRWTIGDIEALLIQSLGTQHRGNAVQMRFVGAEHWTQLMEHETERYLERLEKPPASRAREPERRQRRVRR